MAYKVTLIKKNSANPKNKPKPVLLLINASTSGRLNLPPDRTQERLADYVALKMQLQADIIDWDTIAANNWSRVLSKIVGRGVTLAVLAWFRRNRYRFFYSDSENNGLVLALFFKFTHTRRPLFIIGHWITPPKKAVLFKLFKVHNHFTKLFLHSSEQYKKVIEQFNVPASKVKMLPYQVDTEFWKPQNAHPLALAGSAQPDPYPYICTAGLEFRDYATLIEAVKDLPVQLKIGAASHWSKRKANVLAQILPSNVEVNSYNYYELRDLYAGSLFVVVPLVDVDFQAGITVILEAMAMGKAVVVTRSKGQGDTVIDRRKTTRGGAELPTVGNLGQFFGDNEFQKEAGQTGFYVTPGDPAELRRAIAFLLANPARLAEMGQSARRMVENLMRVEQFADRIRQVIEEEVDIQLLSPNLTVSQLEQGKEECSLNGLPL